MNALKLLGVLALATSVVLVLSGTGSFTAMEADRPAQLAVTDDKSALIGYDANCEKTSIRDRFPSPHDDDDLIDASLFANKSMGSDDDVVDASIRSRETAETDNDLVDASVLANESRHSDDDLVDIDVISKGTGIGIGGPGKSLKSVELTVTITNQFNKPLKGTVTIGETEKSFGAIPVGERENVTFVDGFSPGESITVEATEPTRATLHRTVPADCSPSEKGKAISFVAFCGVASDTGIALDVLEVDDHGDPEMVYWESDEPVAVVVTKAGSGVGGGASGPGLQNHYVTDETTEGTVTAYGSPADLSVQHPSSPCPDGLNGVKFDWKDETFVIDH